MEILLDQQEIKKPDGIKWRDRLFGLKKKYLQSLPRSGLVLQRELAKKIGVNEMTIVNWEKGRTKPTKRNLEWLKKLLGIESIS